MPIIVCGINHKTAPIELREKVVFPLEKISLYLADLLSNDNINEALLLSTCNRSELYCDSDDAEQLADWFCQQHQLLGEQLKPALYVYRGEEAVQHIMQVACGLDSMILGESQILGQMKEAFSESCAAGAVGPLFNRLFQQVFAVAKEVRANTSIGACPVSVASAAVGLGKQLVADLSVANVLVIGAGDTADLVLRYLKSQAPAQLLIANRKRENAVILAEKYQAEAFSFTALPNALARADLVISATGATLPVLTKKMLEPIMVYRSTKPLTLIDIAVPRDIEAAVAELPFIRLRCIDDLKMIIQHNMMGREHAAEKAREVIQFKAREFVSWLSSLDLVATTIRTYRRQIEDMSQTELTKAARQLQRGVDPIQVLAGFAHALTNKMLHAPSAQLRQAGVAGRVDILELAQELFALPQVETEIL
jgi:glutamyl-tRNA reductase